MFRVYEIFDENLSHEMKNFSLENRPHTRAFVLDENGVIGIGAITLMKTRVLLQDAIIRLKPDSSESKERFYDLLLRSVLFRLQEMGETEVFFASVNPSLAKFGFVEKNGEMTVRAKDIELRCH